MQEYIEVRGASQNNLKKVNIKVPKHQLVVFTGVSGSGKSSLAFDTIYVEGQRRYVESLSAYARQFLEMQEKPDVEFISGLSPAIAIDQKTTSRNPRSTVSTATEIYDYLRLLFARIGVPYSEATGKPIEKQTASQIIEIIKGLPVFSKILILSPVVRGQKGEHRREFMNLQRQGYQRVKIDGIVYQIDDLPVLDKNLKHTIEVVVDRLEIEEEMDNRLADSVETSLKMSGGLLNVEIVSLPEDYSGIDFVVGQAIGFSEKFACPITGFTLSEIEPRIFSFNSPYGACPECDGLGTEIFFDPILVIPDAKLSLKEGAIAPWYKSDSKYSVVHNRMYTQTLEGLAKHYNFSLLKPFNELSEDVKNIILFGSNGQDIVFKFDDGFRTNTVKKPFDGVIPSLIERVKKTESDYIREEMSKYQSYKACSSCDGMRLKKESLCVKIAGMNIGQVCRLTITDAIEWVESLKEVLSPKHWKIGERVLKEIKRRLGFLNDVGLEYLTLNRQANTLSGGESQRIRLASQIGSGLSGVLYVLDEPSIGLHQCDNDRLLNTLRNLRDLGNTVIVVEHDEDTMRASDYIIDVGPGAGIHGGEIISHGKPEDVANDERSITGQYLSGKQYIPIPSVRRQGLRNKFIDIKGAKANNLKDIDVKIPLGTFTAITGVSGSGKSSLTIQTLYKAAVRKLHGAKAMHGQCTSISGFEFVDKVIEIDQSPIGRTPRSNPATYTGAFTPIRDWFTSLSESKVRGYKAGRFSFNVKGGRCEVCEGDGVIKIEMHFLPDVYVKCDECNGKRYNKETLEVKYKGCSIADVLDMTVDDAELFFNSVPLIHEKLKALQEVGLGYMKVGQPATTLSGGEAQRVKLAKELSRRSTGRTLYILDEPTTGLHTHDIKKLLEVLHKLVDSGNTVIVIEHNLDVIKTSDYVIDIGPYGGIKGGNLVASGTPEDVSNAKGSITGMYLKRYLIPEHVVNKE